MNINTIKTYNNYVFADKQQNTPQKNTLSNTVNTASSLGSYPQNYYVSFGSKNFDEVFEEHKNREMPSTVRNFIENQQCLLSDEDFNALKKLGLKQIQRRAFDGLKDCKTVADIKAKYPNEEYFKNIKPLNEVKTDSRFFSEMQKLERNGVKTLSCEEDVATFLVKKVYYEGKTYKGVMKDLKAAITPEAESLKQELETYTIARGTFFLPLGLKVPNGQTYGRDLQNSDAEFLKARKKHFEDLSPEAVTEKIQKLLILSEKSRYSMMDAWNHCEQARFDLSNFLTENYNNPAFSMLSPDQPVDIYDDKFYTKQHKLMVAFWEKYPQHKIDLGCEIAVALERFDKCKSLPLSEFEEYKKSIEARSEEIRQNIQFSKVNVNNKYPNAIKLLTAIAGKANPMSMKSEPANNDFAKLILSNTTIPEYEILEGDASTPEYQKLVPDGIKTKMRALLKTPEYTNLSNSQNLAILQDLIEESVLTEEDVDSIIAGKKPLNEVTKEIVAGTSPYLKGRTISQANIDETYEKYKQRMNGSEIEKVKSDLLAYNPNFKKEDEIKLDVILSTQGKYLKTADKNNHLRKLTQTLFWNEFDRINRTNYSSTVVNNIKLDKTIEEAIGTIENMDFSDVEGFDW